MPPRPGGDVQVSVPSPHGSLRRDGKPEMGVRLREMDSRTDERYGLDLRKISMSRGILGPDRSSQRRIVSAEVDSVVTRRICERKR